MALRPARSPGCARLCPMPLPPESHRLQPNHLPTPFSAAEIRDACPAGRTIRIREEAPGEAPSFRRIRFTQVDEETAIQEFQATNADDRSIGEPNVRSSTWLDLQRHASQPAKATTVDEVVQPLAFGDFDCWRYIVRAPGAELRFWFAKQLPGMPVQVEEWINGELAGRSVMIANETPARWGMPVEKDESASKTRG
jgi:hypothetical protein